MVFTWFYFNNVKKYSILASSLRKWRQLLNNALKYVKILESTGITREQAEAQIQIISDILEGDLATKQDVDSLKQEIKNLDVKFESRFESIEHKILQSEYRMTIKLGSIVTIALAAATAVIKLL